MSRTELRPITHIAGRTVLVTGAGNGLGLATSKCLAAAGARVVMVGRNQAKLEAAATSVADVGPWVRAIAADVSEPEDVDALAAALRDEPISILVNNAGIAGPVAPLIDVSVAEWDEVFAVNVRGMFLVTKAFLPGMIDRQFGDVINLASVSGKRPLAGRTPYCASKMAVLGLTNTLGAEVGEYGIRVNSLSPGPVSGPRMERNFAFEAQRRGITTAEAEAEFVGRATLNRLVTEDEVAEAVLSILTMTGLHCADIDLSAGMVAR